MMKKRKLFVLVGFIAVLMAAECVYAATTWTDTETWSLDAGDGYSTTTTTGSKLGATKTTNSTEWDVYTASKTMVTFPKAKLVNSNGETRSDIVTTAAKGKYNSGDSNTGSVGYAEYLSVKPGVLQTGTETIKLQFRNY